MSQIVSTSLTELTADSYFPVNVDRRSMALAWHLVRVIDLQDSLDTLECVSF
jgi:hypothetical protein